MLPQLDSYDAIYNAFKWHIPAHYNMAHDVCDRHKAHKTALIYVNRLGEETRTRFGEIKEFSCRFANVLQAHGIGAGDRVGILLPQCVETAVTHIACYRLGAIALPLFTLFGEEALEYRLQDSGARVLVTNLANLEKVTGIRSHLPELKHIFVTDSEETNLSFWKLNQQAKPECKTVKTAAEDPAVLIYTSGTTGPPKGALHAHRFLLGHMPSMSIYHEFFPQPGDLFYSPADWAWIGGLMDVLMPAWYAGVPVLVLDQGKFDPEYTLQMMANYKVQNTFLPPTALKMMRLIPNIPQHYDLSLRTIFTGGEAMGDALLDWGQQSFGVMINEGYGQTEYNLAVGNCAKIMPVRAGSMGRAIPGHVVEIIDEEGSILSSGQSGQIAFKTPHPVAMLGYWNRPQATQEKYINDWMVSGDLGHKDQDGYFWFEGRKDDVIISAGYRIGPGEVENCLLTHTAVSMAAVIGTADPLRNEIVKAFIVLKPEVTPSDTLKQEIQTYVKTRLAAHEYPRQIEFIDRLPLTATGKIKRNVLRNSGNLANKD